MNKWIDYTIPVALVTVSGVLGYTISEFQHIREHEIAQSMCIPKGHIDAYVSKLGTDEFICFKEDTTRKKITKTLIVLPNRPLD